VNASVLRSARVWRVLGAVVATALAASSPWWGPRTLSAMPYFRLRRVELEGARYLSPSDVLARLHVDTSRSVWDDPSDLERRIARHPQVASVEVRRKLPGTLVVHVTENAPVALVPTARGLVPVDHAARVLPIEPSRVDMDLPIVAHRDTAAMRFLAELRERAPALYDRVSEVRRPAAPMVPGELEIVVPPLLVRVGAGMTADRFADILPVEQDLARRRLRAAELDLRFRDQVVARLQ
jgi:cell division protein FtsQ